MGIPHYNHAGGRPIRADVPDFSLFHRDSKTHISARVSTAGVGKAIPEIGQHARVGTCNDQFSDVWGIRIGRSSASLADRTWLNHVNARLQQGAGDWVDSPKGIDDIGSGGAI